MEPEIRLRHNEFVQMEGWLLKRKAGFDEAEEQDQHNNGEGAEPLFLPTPLAPTGKRLEALLMRNTERKRYFVLTTVRGGGGHQPRAFLTYCTRKPAYVTEDVQLGTLLRGAKKGLPVDVNTPVVRGIIELNDTTDVSVTGDSELTIVVPGKSYHVRPVPKGKTPAEQKIEVGQWHAAIRRAIKDVFLAGTEARRNTDLKHSSSTEEPCPNTMAGVLASKTHRKNFKMFCEFSHAVENMDFLEKLEEYEGKFDAVLHSKRSARASSKRSSGSAKVPKDLVMLGREIIDTHVLEGSPAQVNLSDSNRTSLANRVAKKGDKAFTPDFFEKAKQEIVQLLETNFFMRFYREEERKTGAFSQLYGKNGMAGYEQVLGHFGKVKTDLDRQLGLFDVRVQQTDAKLKVLREALHISHDVAITSFRTNRNAMVQLFRSNAVRIRALDEFRTQIKEHVQFPLQWLKKSIALQLESIIDTISAAESALADAKATVEEKRARIEEVRALAEMAHFDDFPDEAAQMRLRRLNLQVSELEPELGALEGQVSQADMTQTRLTRELEDKVIDSLDKLESLELHRLESQQRAVMHAVESEKTLNQVLDSELSLLEKVADKMEPADDIERFVSAFEKRLMETEAQTGGAE